MKVWLTSGYNLFFRRKIVMFSGHDSSITKVLESIDLTDHIAFPKYAASVFFEVYQTGEKYEVKIMYRSDNYQQEPKALKLKGSEQIP